MITSVTHAPHTYTPAWAPVVWTLYSDATAPTGFKYVLDVYIKGATMDTNIGRIRQAPNLLGYASVDISTLVFPYLNPSNALLEVDRILGSTANFLESEDIVQGVYIMVGEERGGVIYSGLTGATQAGEPGYTATSRDGDYVRVWGAANGTIDAYKNDISGATSYGSYDSYVMKASTPGHFLTSGVTHHTLRTTDHHTLTFFNRWYGATSSTLSTPVGLLWNMYNSAGATVGSNSIQLSTITGAGPRVTAGGTVTWTTPQQEIAVVAVGPVDLSITNVAYYEVYLYDANAARVSDKVGFTIDDDCPGEFPSIRFSWLNKHGGRDYWNFNKGYETSTDSEDSTYTRDPGQWSEDAWSLKPWKSGIRVYNKNLKNSIKTTSDWLTEAEMEHLRGLFSSPNILVYMPGETMPQSCYINDSSFTSILKLAQKMYNLEFTFTLAFGDKVQNC